MSGSITPSDEALWGELNSQTARISWKELERYFARGVLVRVSPEQDLVAVAMTLVRDRAGKVEELIAGGLLQRATDEHARDWSDRDPELWAVVVAPWVLVQERVVNPH